MTRSIIICFLFGFGLLLGSCSESKPEVYIPEERSNFQPLEVGNEWTYAVDSIFIYLGGDQRDTVHLQLKDRITEVEEINNVTRYYITRSHRPDESQPWRDIEIWWLEVDEDRLYANMKSRRFVKLVYPLDLGTRWNPTLYFNENVSIPVGPNSFQFFQSWNAEVTDINAEEAVVILVDSDNIYRKVYAEERYQAEVGLSYLEYLEYNLSSSTPDERPWEEKIDYGFKVTQTLIDFHIQ